MFLGVVFINPLIWGWMLFDDVGAGLCILVCFLVVFLDFEVAFAAITMFCIIYVFIYFLMCSMFLLGGA